MKKAPPTKPLSGVAIAGLFCVAPLKWRKNARNEYVQSWWASTPFGSYTVERHRENPAKGWGQWNLKWCFDEYYDESEERVESLADGKRKAWSNWMERLGPALISQNSYSATRLADLSPNSKNHE